MTRKSIWIMAYRQRQGLYNVCECRAFCTGQSQRAISESIYKHAMVLSEDNPSSVPHILCPPRAFNLETGRRDQVIMASNEGGAEKHKSSEDEVVILNQGRIDKCLGGWSSPQQSIINWKRFVLEINIWLVVLGCRKKSGKISSLKSHCSDVQPFKLIGIFYWNNFPGLRLRNGYSTQCNHSPCSSCRVLSLSPVTESHMVYLKVIKPFPKHLMLPFERVMVFLLIRALSIEWH